jgi:sugar lactone lactonase YvrE
MNTLRIRETAGVLPEGPMWDHRTGALLWVDINAGKLMRWIAGRHIEIVCSDPDYIPGVWLADHGNLAMATCNGIRIVSADGNHVTVVAGFPAIEPSLRFNDGGVDARGRLLIGTMARSPALYSTPLGCLFRIDGAGGCEVLVEGLTISNGLGWSQDGEVLYLVDSMHHRVLAIPYGSTHWPVHAEKCQAFPIPEEFGIPDWLCVGNDDTLMVAAILGGRILDITPKGTIARSIALPATCPTLCCFGGAKMDTLFITTSTHLLGPDHHETLAGHVLALSSERRGSRMTEFKSGIGK